MLSYVQLKILSHALKNNSLRYSDLKPDDITQDLFNYHLKFLLDKKYIKKEGDFYELTDFGKKYVIQMDVKGEYKTLFRVSVISITIRENNGKKEILMQKRLRHPYYGETLYGISGKVLQGEKVEIAAKRKLEEETALKCNYDLVGINRKIRYDSKHKLIEDTLYHICYGINPEGELDVTNDFGLNFWVDEDKSLELMKDNLTYSKFDEMVFNRVIVDQNKSLFYWEQEQTLEQF